MAAMQCFFRQNGSDLFAGDKAHKYGSSPANQRIEGWWSFFRRGRAGWWIDFFKDMVTSGILDLGNTLHMECLWFCFHGVINNELERVKMHWNTHRIRHSSNHGTVSGIPDVMYYLPERSGGIDCKYAVTEQKVQEMELKLQIEENDDEIAVYQEYFHYVMLNDNLQFPCTAAEGFDLFQKLLAFASP
jgi:hypothetical protein